jgi:uncharacterized protein
MSLSSDNGRARRYLIFLISIPGRELTPEVVKRHATHLAQLDREGKLVLAGPIPERAGGLIVLQVPSLEHARAIADEDPMITAGFQRYELGTWIMSNRDNGYAPPFSPE